MESHESSKNEVSSTTEDSKTKRETKKNPKEKIKKEAKEKTKTKSEKNPKSTNVSKAKPQIDTTKISPFEWLKDGELAKIHTPSTNPLNTKKILEKHLNETLGKVITRFPPEPNGYLHIGHAKALNLSFDFCRMHGGDFILRFDDTNPKSEKNEFVDQIKEDICWLLESTLDQQEKTASKFDADKLKKEVEVRLDNSVANFNNGPTSLLIDSEGDKKLQNLEIVNESNEFLKDLESRSISNEKIKNLKADIEELLSNERNLAKKSVSPQINSESPASQSESSSCKITKPPSYFEKYNEKIFTKITYASDYFDKFLKLAFELIKNGDAYVCNLTQEEMKIDREKNRESPFRNRPIETNLMLFQEMVDGKWKEGTISLRMKQDMSSKNPLMHDLVAYRVIDVDKNPHYRTGTKFKVFPSYDFTHCINDSLENITHSFCSREFFNRKDTYYWLLDKLNLYKPVQWEFSRLNITDTMLSKRKIIELINKGLVKGWDDPRLYTLCGLRRRGFTSNGINMFVKNLGITFNQAVIDIKNLENYVREDLNVKCERMNCVTDPLLLNVCEVNDNNLTVIDQIFIEKSDFSKDGEKGFMRLTKNQPVGLMQKYTVKFLEFDADKTNVSYNIKDLHVKITESLNKIKIDELNNQSLFSRHDFKSVKNSFDNFDTLSNDKKHYEEIFVVITNEKPKKFIHWVDKHNHTKIELRMYSNLLINNEFNCDSLVVKVGYCEDAINKANVGDTFQFRRVGYFCVDKDTTTNNIIVNLTLPLRNSTIQ
ncbi:hypothetical protein EDEG_03810 [Edhazardia aedis USNM 41457]|uniref:Probable glutamate--tRNA ligase, cytoplasmic n=1 Tax=Edhazardia aedis (strain USNM 41457) TaxID=1003232 RepID=J9D1D6_EDHAE|nr:hypothetical protein EDEG_03810 [Edhazardia aedis USNM 41457]|eukprot:EJW01646.1 hypothetical protein EDEG_03810 [Edhazardia aedis USNM 41457]